jgi:hypothetical protein
MLQAICPRLCPGSCLIDQFILVHTLFKQIQMWYVSHTYYYILNGERFHVNSHTLGNCAQAGPAVSHLYILQVTYLVHTHTNQVHISHVLGSTNVVPML